MNRERSNHADKDGCALDKPDHEMGFGAPNYGRRAELPSTDLFDPARRLVIAQKALNLSGDMIKRLNALARNSYNSFSWRFIKETGRVSATNSSG